MKDRSGLDYFEEARKLAMREYNRNISSGEIGYLSSLEGVVKNSDIASEVNLGIVEIPLKKIIGTYSHLRSMSFARNFMPLLKSETEFEYKWSKLCETHLTEGIQDPIKVYEYLNWFYVIEGNKRVSVLKFFEAHSIAATVIRLIPKKDEQNPSIRGYYEFLKFNKETGLFSLWLSKESSFKELLDLLKEYNPPLTPYDTKYKYFEVYIYKPFREIYLEGGGDKLSITTGDAFLEYCKIYGVPQKIEEEALRSTMKEFIKELELLFFSKTMSIQTEPEEVTPNKLFTTLSTLVIPKKKWKIAFAYARTIEGSGWTYAHELGRRYIEKQLEDMVTTHYIENVPEEEGAYEAFKNLAEEGYEVIFTTSPIFLKDTLKCALEYPNVKFFNCSEAHPYQHVANYYGRTYETRFLTGIIAGAMTKSNLIGYVATSPTPEVMSSINAFALGAKMVNPRAKVLVAWTNEWNSRVKFTSAGEKLIEAGVDLVCNRNLQVPHPVSTEYGVYSMLCTVDKEKKKPDQYLATPIRKWGVFYEKMLRNIMNDTFKTVVDLFSMNSKLINFWWGIDAGVIDIFYAKELVPQETQKLVNLLRRMIMNNTFHPFTGPIYDQKGKLRVEEEEIASHEEILTMDWFVDIVEEV